MTTENMQFEIGLGRARAAALRSDAGRQFRVLVLGDITGHEPEQRTTPLAQRTPIRVDVDNLPQVFARLAPRLSISLEGTPLTVEFRSLDDFHPDNVFRRLAPFASLRELRAELKDPKLFRRAAAALGVAPVAETRATGAEPAEAASDIERLLGRAPQAKPAAAPAAAALDAWLRNAVAPHVVADTAQEQQQLIAAVDAATAEQMRRVLSHRAFQALEASWRGITRLVNEVESEDTLQVYLLDASREELANDIAAAERDLGESGLYRHLCGAQTEPPDGQPWSLLVGDYAFGTTPQDVKVLAVLGAMAARAGAPLLAGASLEVLGCGGIECLAEPKSWSELDSETALRWRALRTSAGAPWIGLALPRVLARLPYGARTDPIESFAFEELPISRDHEAYLWGNPAFALAVLAAQAFQRDGWAMDLDRHLDITDLPSHTYRQEGEAKLQPCAEVLVGESAAEAILARGVMPLLSYRNRNAARLLRWQSLAEPPQALRGVWVG
jgi:type VI secretion system protein ImpC